jgi:hypothetical protein
MIFFYTNTGSGTDWTGLTSTLVFISIILTGEISVVVFLGSAFGYTLGLLSTFTYTFGLFSILSYAFGLL